MINFLAIFGYLDPNTTVRQGNRNCYIWWLLLVPKQSCKHGCTTKQRLSIFLDKLTFLFKMDWVEAMTQKEPIAKPFFETWESFISILPVQIRPKMSAFNLQFGIRNRHWQGSSLYSYAINPSFGRVRGSWDIYPGCNQNIPTLDIIMGFYVEMHLNYKWLWGHTFHMTWFTAADWGTESRICGKGSDNWIMKLWSHPYTVYTLGYICFMLMVVKFLLSCDNLRWKEEKWFLFRFLRTRP